ncbi:short chain enoyl-CoA hydratase [Yoonia maricola]|uniref:Short chain enoyl-CoA hydratase n=1 Tax=Yoonia maricola TaxID=420999 RepID=A0A2M8W141_9RHOB|nr:crotonase/enoyl-CoA hydratase family protein [Yoonia maricola]PJI84629.1 short chain enoyl-CoA hydratase [Yoonia maricola]
MSDEVVLYHVENGVATVTLNRPDQRNAINPEVCDAIRAAFDQVEANPDVRVAILTGAGTLFCAGMDLKAFAGGAGDTILFGEYGFGGFVKRCRTKPVIAAVEGAALAGGFEMMLACDMVVAGASAQFALPEVRIGLIPGAGGAVRLPVAIPRVRANEILLTGKPFTAQEAADWGVINRVTADGDALMTAKTIAADIASNAPLAVRHTLAIATAAHAENDTAHWPANDRIIAKIGQSADAAEGARAFVEKRAPVWQGK